jgi:predicted ATPase
MRTTLVMSRRVAVTGAPGSGKTSLLSRLAGQGIEVVAEAATQINQEMLDAGHAHPDRRPDFLERIVALQRRRRLAARGELQLHDRTVFCTIALARYLQIPEPASLLAEARDVDGWFETDVLFVNWLGFLTPTPVRRIGREETRRFEAVHRAVYQEFGFTLIDVARGSIGERRAAVLDYLCSAR